MFSIYKREIYSFFTTPIGYIYIAMFWAVSSVVFCFFTLLAGKDSNITSYFTAELIVIAVMAPLLTMKSFSEDRKLKTEQLLLTAPVSLPGLVGAKFLSCYSMFGATFLVSCINLPIMFSYINDESVYTYSAVTALGGVVALFLIGAALISVGVLISALTENQIVAAGGTYTAYFLLIGATIANSMIGFAPIRELLRFLGIYSRFTNFSAGYFDISAIIYYISFTVVCLFITVRVYEKRRWA